MLKRLPFRYLGARAAGRQHRIEAAIESEFTRGCTTVHVVPCFEGEREHVESTGCWCAPVPDTVDARVIVHNRRATA